MLFPLGSACKVNESIQRYLNNKNQTNLFDWVASNFESVLYFILNIDTPLKKDDFYWLENNCDLEYYSSFYNMRIEDLHP